MEKKEEISSLAEFKVKDGIGYMILNNGTFNVIDDAVFLDLDIFKQWCEEYKIKGLIITGNGRHFSSGANVEYIKRIRNDSKILEDNLNAGKEILDYIQHAPFITVAAINGACFGAGFEIALRCKYRICTSSAIFAFPESSLGIMPGFGGTIYLPKIVGQKKALEIIFSTETLNSEQALELGLVDKISDKKNILDESVNIINNLCKGKTDKQIKYILNTVFNNMEYSEKKLCELESNYFVELAKDMVVQDNK